MRLRPQTMAANSIENRFHVRPAALWTRTARGLRWIILRQRMISHEKFAAASHDDMKVRCAHQVLEVRSAGFGDN